MKVIKRDGREVSFCVDKIKNAIMSCGVSGGYDTAFDISREVASECEELGRAVTVEEIQDMVEDELCQRDYSAAKRYIKYRYQRELSRKTSVLDDRVLALIDNENEDVKQENSNKNSVVNSVQRDYMAGELSRHLTENVLLPEDVVEAHNNGLIHFHDADYFAQHMYNCFHSKTRFVTSEGVRAFKDCKDGEKVEVLDRFGNWREAIVHKYERQRMQEVTLNSGRTFKTVRCTFDHRWILKDGTVTTDLKEGDRLALLEPIERLDIIPKYFCLGFLLGDGTDYNGKNSAGSVVRLCGEKIQYASMFDECGYNIRQMKNSNDLLARKPGEPLKQDFLNGKCWRFLDKAALTSLFLGYYAADGAKQANRISTSDSRIAEMIRSVSAVAGYHVCKEKYEVRTTNFKDHSELWTFTFMVNQPTNRNWKVVSINREDRHTYDSWCVEEPVTNSFTLDGGIITGNCCLVNLEDMLQNGTVISETMIDKPHSFSTACNIATQIIAQVASNQYGGQSISLAHLAPFVDVSRKKIKEQVTADVYDSAELYSSEYDAIIKALTESRLREEIRKGVQTIQYQIVTLLTTNGQAPFLTEFMYLGEAKSEQEKEDLALIIEETLKQRIKGVKNQNGTWVTPAFPKLIYVLEEDNIREDSKYYYLTRLAAKCTAKRMVPDYISEKKMKELKDGYCFPVMGCRSALAPWYDENGEAKFYGRFNQGVVTINLPDVALTSVDTGRDFYDVLDERLNLCHKALLCRHKRLEGTLSDVAPILWQHGALARLKPGEKIDSLLHGGYSSISLGYAGLWECVKALTGKTLLDPEGKELGLQIMREMNAYCQEWTAEDDIGYSIYGTPLESVTYKFAKCLQNRFGVIEGITDKTYITNSYHIHVTEPVDAFTKLTEEADFQDLSKGGAISYVEVPDMTGNIEAVLSVIKHIYETNMYAELNTKSDHCDACGFDGQIEVIEDDGKLIWECPQCGNRNAKKMSIVRRTCGYLGTQGWNQGRTAEIKERVEHL